MFTGKQIRDKRKAENLSVEALATKIGVGKENLYKWEKGTQPSNPEDYIKVSNWLENVPRGTKNAALIDFKPNGGGGLDYKEKYIAILERENSTLLNQLRLNLEKLEELSNKVSQNYAVLSSLRFAIAMILTGQRKWNLKNLSPGEVSNLLELADTLDTQCAAVIAEERKRGNSHVGK